LATNNGRGFIRQHKKETAVAGLGFVIAGAVALAFLTPSGMAWQDGHSIQAPIQNDSKPVLGVSTDGVNFAAADAVAPQLTSALEAGDTVSGKVWVKNLGEKNYTFTQSDITGSGSAFSGATPDTTTLAASLVGTSLTPNQVEEVDYSVAAPATQSAADYSDASGTVTITFNGENSSHYVAPATQVATASALQAALTANAPSIELTAPITVSSLTAGTVDQVIDLNGNALTLPMTAEINEYNGVHLTVKDSAASVDGSTGTAISTDAQLISAIRASGGYLTASVDSSADSSQTAGVIAPVSVTVGTHTWTLPQALVASAQTTIQ
jgi:hypothetical protein